MVFFTCNTCGSSLKKNQVEKHYQNECPRCEVLSCMDCGRDFYGDEYASHTKCISEAEKYQGSTYKESASTGKGERKQQEWLEKVKQSVRGTKVNPRIGKLLQRVAAYPNIPRKKAKFENFVRNSINVRDQQTLNELWEVFSSLNQQSSEKSGPKGEEEEEEKASSVDTVEQGQRSDSHTVGGGEGESPSEKDPEELPKKKKKKKHKSASSPEEMEGDSVQIPGPVVNGEGLGRKREKDLKGKIAEESAGQEVGHDMSIDDRDLPPKRKKKKKKQVELTLLKVAGDLAVEDGQEAVEKSEVPELERNGQVREDEPQDGDGSAHRKKKKKNKKKKAEITAFSAVGDSEVVGEGEVEEGEGELEGVGVGPVEVALSYINGGHRENGGREGVKGRKRKVREEEGGEEVEGEEGKKAKKKAKHVQCGEDATADDDNSCLESATNTGQMKKVKKHKKHKH